MGVVAQRRSRVALLGLAAAVALALAGAYLGIWGRGSAAAGSARGSGTKLQIKTTSQRRIVETERIRIRARSLEGPATARFSAYTRHGESPKRIANPRRDVFIDRDWRKLRLHLTARGVERVRRCIEQELIVDVYALPHGGDVNSYDYRSRPLRLTLPECSAPPGSNRVYSVTPSADATHANGTPRDLAATSTRSDQVLVGLFACAGVGEAAGELVFQAQDGKAVQGASGAGITKLNGNPVAGSPQTAGPASAQGGQLPFTISGADGCAAPVVFRDANSNGALDVDGTGVPTERYGGGGETTFEPQGVEFQNADRCDPTDPAVCLYPWPNDHFTVTDPATDTGRRINLQSASMPQNRFGVPIDNADYNRNDGFSPGQLVVTKVPGLETPQAFENTDPVPITDIGRYAEPDAPVVVINAETGERQPIFTELDANPADPADVTLLVRPAVNWEEGARYVVALRHLRDAADQPIPAQRAFQLYRDGIVTSDPAVESRRDHFEQLFDEVGEAGIERDDLYLAWDFTVASERNLSERMLSIRDRAFAALGDTNLADLQVAGAPPSTIVTGVTDYGPCGNDGCAENPITGEATEDDRIARKVEGAIAVPCFPDGAGCPPGSRFSFGADGLPQQNPVPHLAQFECLIPRSTVDGGPHPARPSLYGHGLLGDRGEVEAGNVKSMANEHDFMFCATDWAGFATPDVPTVLASLQDLSNFPRLVDRMQQGFLNQLYLGRAMIHPQGLAANPAFQLGGQSLIDTTRLFYDGNSQGGIMGGGLTAVAPDFDRAALGVPAMNYSTLLQRSSDFAPYAEGKFCGAISDDCEDQDTDLGLYDNYPDELERPLILSMIQMLWDRGEADGYADHMTSDPLANTPPHQVLMHVAFGDHQVTNVAAGVEARTIGASSYQPALDPGRIPGGDSLWNIPAIPSYPFDGSAIVYWDSGPPREGDEGVLNPPTTNTPPNSPEYGRDPHGDPRSTPAARTQKSAFLSVDGTVINVCDDHPCYAHGWAGPP